MLPQKMFLNNTKGNKRISKESGIWKNKWQFYATNIWTPLETCFNTEIITFPLSWYFILTYLLRKRRIIEKSEAKS